MVGDGTDNRAHYFLERTSLEEVLVLCLVLLIESIVSIDVVRGVNFVNRRGLGGQSRVM